MPKFKCDIFGDFKHSAKCSKEILFERWASLKLPKCLPEIKSNLQKLPDDWKLLKKIKITLLKITRKKINYKLKITKTKITENYQKRIEKLPGLKLKITKINSKLNIIKLKITKTKIETYQKLPNYK